MKRLIDGVVIKKLKVIKDKRGRLMEILRRDDKIFERFGQVYMTSALPGVVKAWHYHRKQTDHFLCVHGKVKVALYDARKGSPTHKRINEFIMTPQNPILLKIPRMVYHGFKCIADEESFVINIPTKVYNYSKPDEFRVDPYNDDIPYDWRS